MRVDDRGYVFPDFELRKPQDYEGPQWRIDRLKALFPAETDALDRYWADYLRFTGVMTLARRLEAATGLGAMDELRIALNAGVAAGDLDFFFHRKGSPDTPIPKEVVSDAVRDDPSNIFLCYVAIKHPRESSVRRALSKGNAHDGEGCCP